MPPIPTGTRLARVQQALAAAGSDWLVVPASSDFRWLTGAHARVSERLVAFALPARGEGFLLAPRLEAGPIERACPDLEMLTWDEHEDPIARLVERAGIGRASSLRLGDGLRVPQVLALAGLAHCESAGDVIAAARSVKDAEELSTLAMAAAHADEVMAAAIRHASAGMTERELERFVLEHFVALGDTGAWAIVASGPHSAEPHHHSTDRTLAAGDVLLLDLGAWTDGYASDLTRMSFLGEPPRQVLRVHDIVSQARAAGVAAVRAGAIAEDVDAAARTVIEGAGLGEHFTHRTGHGLGLDGHETPYLVRGNRTPLFAGQVHSVEPGVYLPGRFGIRLEDVVVVEPGGARVLGRAPLELLTAGPRA